MHYSLKTQNILTIDILGQNRVIGCVRKGNFMASYHVSEVSILLSTSEEFWKGNFGAWGFCSQEKWAIVSAKKSLTISVLIFRWESSLRVMMGYFWLSQSAYFHSPHQYINKLQIHPLDYLCDLEWTVKLLFLQM